METRREHNLERLASGRLFDLLIIGGGATGCGTALDAASRGLDVALVDSQDFAAGTSGRSTKLIHGGVRYLEAAVKQIDPGQYNLVRDGLRERWRLLRNAPHLCWTIPLITPLYRWHEIPYITSGLKLYDLLAGRRSLGHSQLLSRAETLRRLPALNSDGLKAGVLYYDGQFNDARLAVSLAVTAARHGATVANHLAVTGLLHDGGDVAGAELRDRLTGARMTVQARGVVNATGPFVDEIRAMDDPHAARLLTLSAGMHLVLDRRFAPPGAGLMIPKTDDGRILFVLPWGGHALVGTTDVPAELGEHPQPTAEQIDYLLRHLGRYLKQPVGKQEIKATWAGLRPLLSAGGAASTAKLSRDHLIETSRNRLLTITGGKWTTYRKMAEETVDRAIKLFALAPDKPACQTKDLPIVGSDGYAPDGDRRLATRHGLDDEVARHLHCSYGDRAEQVVTFADDDTPAARLVPGHPLIEAEVRYVVRHEFAVTALDVLARRLSLAVLDTEAARQAADRVIAIMAEELGWDAERRTAETDDVAERLTNAL
ncbi:MAG: FAD-dependent oxidoreductase [Desulfuromonadales bacterium]|nr:FAD-dependent oxidoreductase [Desulfuromonadales bacterium]